MKHIAIITLLFFVVCIYSFTSEEKAPMYYSFFKVADKGGCYTTKSYETFMMMDKIDYSLKQKIIQKKKEALIKDSETKVTVNSFTLNATDWIVIYKANYGKRECKTGNYISIKCLKISDESKIEEAIEKSLANSFVSETYVSHEILIREQPNNSIGQAPIIDKICKQIMDFLPQEDKKEFKKSTAIGVRG